MKYKFLSLFILGLISLNCSNTVTGPPAPNSGKNLLANSTFEVNGNPSLSGWFVPDTEIVHFSSDIPQDGSGNSIIMHARFILPSNTISTTALPIQGTHLYTLSIISKSNGVAGNLSLYLNRPGNSNSSLVVKIPIHDNSWTFYSQTDTITATAGDTLFVLINGGVGEIAGGTTYFNTCKLEKF